MGNGEKSGGRGGTARLFWGFVFLVVGVLLLLGNLGLVGWQMLWAVFQLWPLFVILAGLLLLLRRKPAFYSWIAVIAVFAVGALLLVFAGPGWSRWNGWEYDYQYRYGTPRGEKRVEVPWQGAPPTVGRLRLDFGAQRLELSGDRSLTQAALVGDLAYWGPVPSFRYSYGGEGLDVRIGQEEKRWPVFFGSRRPGGETFAWRLHLSDKTAWDVDLNTGASDSVLDFSALRVRSVRVDSGASKIVLRFGDTGGNITGKIQSGVSDIRVEIPPEVGVRLRVDGALANTNIAGKGFIFANETYTSPNFAGARTKIDLDLEIGLSNLTVAQPGGSI